MSEYKKPIPVITSETAQYWDSAQKHDLHIQKCCNCNRFYFYPRDNCPFCFSNKVEWTRVTGKGKIYSFTVSYRYTSEGFRNEIPYNIAIVELEEGIRMMTNIVGCENDDLRIGMPVEIIYEDITDTVTLPKFKPTIP